MKRFAYGLIVCAGLISPVRAEGCADGIHLIEQVADRLGLSTAEQSKVKAMLAKARAVAQHGRERECKITGAGVLRFLLVRTVVD